MNEAAKAILTGLVKSWTKFVLEKTRLEATTREVAALASKAIQRALAFLKEQNMEIECSNPDSMSIMKVPVKVIPVVEEHFPSLKATVNLRCGEAHRAILIDLSLNVNAGGSSIPFEQFKHGIPETFTMNAVEFVKDAFLYVARTGGKPHPSEAGTITVHPT